ncbi:TrkH family potassium uptake protein [Pseudonocardia pini]|uniref:TrkH family potassium uptake protein n=1 Tax=Pseudonocardia pini TaxID=2758030 RepID=UPI0015EFFF59|nr:potassium transporter TrkG [Pseudonocardia pini]
MTAPGRLERPGRVVRHRPASAIVGAFVVAAAAGTVLLSLPVATESGARPPLMTALFTAVSAVSVTGLGVVDTATYWSSFGEVAILALVQAGGVGIMTSATLLGLLISRRLGLRLQLTAQTETRVFGLGEVRRVLGGILLLSLGTELVVAAPMAVRFATEYGESPGRAAYLGIFHAVMAFNNAGFALYADSVVSFATDPWICVPIVVAVVVGGIGFPVLLEIARRVRSPHGRWTLHTRLTVSTYLALGVVGFVGFLVLEWSNAGTVGGLGVGGKLLVGFFQGAMPRSAGFNSIDVVAMEPVTLFLNDLLMFVGGGSAGTSGGIKVTTFALLAYVIWAEVRGEPTVHVGGRRVSSALQREALTVALLAVGTVAAGTVVVLTMSRAPLDLVLFEVVSAFGTVGMTTGLSAELPAAGQAVILVLMFLGRLGPVTLATALALRQHTRRYELPEERTIIG